MRKAKIVWTYTADMCKRECFGEALETMAITFRACVVTDAAAQVADAVRHNPSMASYYTDRAAKIRAMNEKHNPSGDNRTIYYSGIDYDSRVEMKAQRNLAPKDYGLEWYALRLEGGHVTRLTIQALTKLVGIDSPERAIEALRAVPVHHADESGAWVACAAPTFLDFTKKAAA